MKLDFRRMSMAEIAYVLKGVARELESREPGRGGRPRRPGYPLTSANPQYGGNDYGGQPADSNNPRYQRGGGGYPRGGGLPRGGGGFHHGGGYPRGGGHRGFRERRGGNAPAPEPRNEPPASNDGGPGEGSPTPT